MADYILCSSSTENRQVPDNAGNGRHAEANAKYRAFFCPGSLSFTFGADVNDKIDLQVLTTML
jgi:hypothetical protein